MAKRKRSMPLKGVGKKDKSPPTQGIGPKRRKQLKQAAKRGKG